MQQRAVCQDRSTEEARQEVLRLADEEAKRVLEAARVWATRRGIARILTLPAPLPVHRDNLCVLYH